MFVLIYLSFMGGGCCCMRDTSRNVEQKYKEPQPQLKKKVNAQTRANLIITGEDSRMNNQEDEREILGQKMVMVSKLLYSKKPFSSIGSLISTNI